MSGQDVDWFAAFPEHLHLPAISLRGANAIDDYRDPPPHDPVNDAPDADYFEEYFWGLSHLDSQAWLHYLPYFLTYAQSQHRQPGSNFVEALLAALGSMHFNVRIHSRLGALQRACVLKLLDRFAFDPDSAWREQAARALQAYWTPGTDHP